MKADEQTLARIYEEYADRVHGFLLSKTRDVHLAEDLTEDVFVKVCEKLDTYDEVKASLSTWIFTIARNKLIDHYRKNRSMAPIPQDWRSDDDIELTICTEETLEKLACALEQLDERGRRIVVGRYYHKRTLKEIADELRISYSYVKVLHSDALKALRRSLE